MPRRTRSDQRSGTRGFTLAGIALLALGVAALAVVAYEHGNPEPQAEAAGPAPVFTLGVQVTPTATPSHAPPPEADREERFLAIGPSAWWRASSPVCGEGEPLLERSTDAGASWTDVTPRYLDVRQILTLAPFIDSEAEIVAARGDGCAVEALRTFTQGEFWSPYPEVLSASTYLDAAGSVHRRGTQIPAPCSNPRSLQAAGDAVTVVCDGRASALTDAGWWTSPTIGVVDAAPFGEQIIVAARDDGCAGIELSRESPRESTSESLACVPTDSPDIALTISPSDSAIVLWVGDVVAQVR